VAQPKRVAAPASQPAASPDELALAFAALELRLSGLAQQALLGQSMDSLLTRRRYMREARRLIDALRSDYRQRAQDTIEAAYGSGARLVGARPPGAIQRAALNRLVEASITRLDASLATVGRQFDDVFRRVGLQQATRQLERELPGEAASELMRRELMRRGVTGLVDKGGRRWRLSTYSQMVIRTTTSEAANRGVADATQAVGRDLVRISAPDSPCRHHPDDPANPCRRLAGETVSLDGKTKGYEVIPGLPPWHPNCQHGIAPAPLPKPELVA
jgi:hypothetical protein